MLCVIYIQVRYFKNEFEQVSILHKVSSFTSLLYTHRYILSSNPAHYQSPMCIHELTIDASEYNRSESNDSPGQNDVIKVWTRHLNVPADTVIPWYITVYSYNAT